MNKPILEEPEAVQQLAIRPKPQPVAIIPQNVEEIWRVGKMIVQGGLAPKSLIGYNKSPEEVCSAVCICIMAGAELGMVPMVSLRQIAVINGRPTLMGEGMTNVVRQSGKAEYVRSGCDNRDGMLVGWCEAKRSDTGEILREEFTQEDAKRARLWDERQRVKRRGKNGNEYETDNDAPWFLYPQRMLKWRAVGYCLRDLFSDVLGGIQLPDEVIEIEGTYREIEPEPTLSAPPPPPAPEEPAQPADKAPEPPAEVKEPEADETKKSDPAEVLAAAETAFDAANNKGDLAEAWGEFEHYQETLPEDDAETLRGLYANRLAELGE